MNTVPRLQSPVLRSNETKVIEESGTVLISVPARIAVSDTFYARRGKRVFDIFASITAIVLLTPILLVVAVGELMLLGRPVLYRQVRLGRSARPFVMLKFRSMRHDRREATLPVPHPERRRTHKSPDDPRHTPFGTIIRRTSIDELPQLFNVLRGDMSIVGPRPELPRIAEQYGIVDHVRHLVRPGLTGLWQISADRPGFVHENVRYDEQYVGQVTLRGDLAIIVRTIPVLLRGSGV
ncbi:MAG: sugar transferase [Acidimicrobiia bacterium]